MISIVNPEYKNGNTSIPIDKQHFELTLRYKNEIEELRCIKSNIHTPLVIPKVIECSDYNLIGILATRLDTEDYCDLEFVNGPTIELLQQKYHIIIKTNEYYIIFRFSSTGVKLMLFKLQSVHDMILKCHHLETLNKLPLVLDLDDTIVRAVSLRPEDAQLRVITANQMPYVQDRLHFLNDTGFGIKQLVLASNAQVFLSQIARICKITVCSAGDPNYVKAVCKVLDPESIYFSSIESTRHMHDYNLLKYNSQNLPTKDLCRLYPFCIPYEHHLLSQTFPPILQMTKQPIIIDDIDQAWLSNQRQQIYLMLPIHKIWDVNLEQCALILQHIYTECINYEQRDIPHLLKVHIMGQLQHSKIEQSDPLELEVELKELEEQEDMNDEVEMDIEELYPLQPVEQVESIESPSNEQESNLKEPYINSTPPTLQQLFSDPIDVIEQVDYEPDVQVSISQFTAK